MLKGFKDFILRGNVIELAVAVVIGSAFTAIVTAFTKGIINPLINAINGNVDASGLTVPLRGHDRADAIVDFGSVITAAINFLIIAAVVYFILIAPMNKLKEIQNRRKGIDPNEAAATETELLEQIRDLLIEQNRAEVGVESRVARDVGDVQQTSDAADVADPSTGTGRHSAN
ncbi:large conductance mechanosensitive channel protein MscL [Corynebacterium bovis]|uniref:Large-conductance mechanosensitive channel n=1 Tax=Corynebacterium bovis TaxID=36808 RepID=A0A3R8QS02_9CORY|nr:large conductance mechanosensitive channel protein MscL [Corynebacterium bovis]RRO90903.1 large conductance mechanosensitive channel protein MscL [Corynebacterium bovis]RRO93913.1 large conductance mechanosensitive channel protein MscL [Corynebacterium bovis]RRO96098.1 large conductance mechanosensitive channel protein MscL [Corynebacterium bovis]RRQ01958.1 large conductance mechanosensitive channel protein MscL [Corynebacterium bovis]RRQ02556.1 large conductance mechanosensitive channel pr